MTTMTALTVLVALTAIGQLGVILLMVSQVRRLRRTIWQTQQLQAQMEEDHSELVQKVIAVNNWLVELSNEERHADRS